MKILKILSILVSVSFGTMCDTRGGIFNQIVSGEIARAKVGKVPPKPLKQVVPIYPEELREKGITGEVEVQFVINPEGITKDIKVLKSPHKLFTESVTVAIGQWIFHPGTENGRPVDCKVKLTFPFTNKKTEQAADGDATG